MWFFAFASSDVAADVKAVAAAAAATDLAPAAAADAAAPAAKASITIRSTRETNSCI